jgi:hypothetical protein
MPCKDWAFELKETAGWARKDKEPWLAPYL